MLIEMTRGKHAIVDVTDADLAGRSWHAVPGQVADPPDREAEVVRLTAACTAVLEDAIRRHPGEWVWMHERWRTRPPEEQEAGANPSPSKAGAEKR